MASAPGQADLHQPPTASMKKQRTTTSNGKTVYEVPADPNPKPEDIFEYPKPADETHYSMTHASRSNPSIPERAICCGKEKGWFNNFTPLYFGWGWSRTRNESGFVKVRENKAYYVHEGKEKSTDAFQFYTASAWHLVPNNGTVPIGALKNNTEPPQYAVVAHTPEGDIPGTTTMDGGCVYPYWGAKYTKNFSYIVVPRPPTWKPQLHYSWSGLGKLETPNESGAILVDEKFYVGVAHTDKGDIPGKVDLSGTCTYFADGVEAKTTDFSHLSAQFWNTTAYGGYIPKRAQGIGFDHEVVLFSVVAHTDAGAIPGYYKDKLCHYTLDGKALTTDDFSWITPHSYRTSGCGWSPAGPVPGEDYYYCGLDPGTQKLEYCSRCASAIEFASSNDLVNTWHVTKIFVP